MEVMLSAISKLLPSVLGAAQSTYVGPATPPKVKPVEDVLTPREQKAQAERDAQNLLANMKNDWVALSRLVDGSSGSSCA